MAKQAVSAEYEHHVVSVRTRVSGGGNLQLSLEDLDKIQTQNLLPLPLQAKTRIEPTVLANMQSQRIRLIGKTTLINENYLIRRIIIYAKPVATEYPL